MLQILDPNDHKVVEAIPVRDVDLVEMEFRGITTIYPVDALPHEHTIIVTLESPAQSIEYSSLSALIKSKEGLPLFGEHLATIILEALRDDFDNVTVEVISEGRKRVVVSNSK